MHIFHISMMHHVLLLLLDSQLLSLLDQLLQQLLHLTLHQLLLVLLPLELLLKAFAVLSLSLDSKDISAVLMDLDSINALVDHLLLNLRSKIVQLELLALAHMELNAAQMDLLASMHIKYSNSYYYCSFVVVVSVFLEK